MMRMAPRRSCAERAVIVTWAQTARMRRIQSDNLNASKRPENSSSAAQAELTAENRPANAHQGGAFSDGHGVVIAHAHGEGGQVSVRVLPLHVIS